MSKAIPCPLSYDEFYDLYHIQNISEGTIAKQYGVSVTVIKSWRKKYGILPKSKEEINIMKKQSAVMSGSVKYDFLTQDTLYDLYIIQDQCASCISDKLSVPIDAIKYYLKKYHIHKSEDDRKRSVERWELEKYGKKRPPKSKESFMKARATIAERKEIGRDYRTKRQKENDEKMFEDALKIDVYSLKLSNKEIANKYNVSISTVKARLRKLSIFRDDNLKTEIQQVRKISSNAYDVLNDKDKFVRFINENRTLSAVDMAKKIGVQADCIYRRAHEYGVRHMINRFLSSKEKEISDFLDSLGVVHRKDRTILSPLEIDCYCPEYRIGIEFNGTYWHSSIFKDKNYHFSKSKAAKEAGVRLIHIYEHEWNDERTRPIVESILRAAFGMFEKRIYARLCEIREISTDELKSFSNSNHLQGHRNASVKYGLFYNGELVQIMSFSRNNKYEWEIIRECSKLNYMIIGGAKRLFTHFVKDYCPHSVFSYADFNKFGGDGYRRLGMSFQGYTGPDMWWIVDDVVLPRSPHKHKELKEKSDAQIWGAGSQRFLWKK